MEENNNNFVMTPDAIQKAINGRIVRDSFYYDGFNYVYDAEKSPVTSQDELNDVIGKARASMKDSYLERLKSDEDSANIFMRELNKMREVAKAVGNVAATAEAIAMLNEINTFIGAPNTQMDVPPLDLPGVIGTGDLDDKADWKGLYEALKSQVDDAALQAATAELNELATSLLSDSKYTPEQVEYFTESHSFVNTDDLRKQATAFMRANRPNGKGNYVDARQSNGQRRKPAPPSNSDYGKELAKRIRK